jgi:hypothetical protein
MNRSTRRSAAAPRGRARVSAAARICTLLAIAGPLALSGCSSTGSSGSTGSTVVASIRGRPILYTTLAHWTAINRAEGPSTPSSEAAASEARAQALKFLITADWLELEAAAQEIDVPTAELVNEYERRRYGLAGRGFLDRQRALGLTRADGIRELRLNRLALKLRAKAEAGTNHVSAAEIDSYYRAHLRAFRRGNQQETRTEATAAVTEAVRRITRERRFNAFTTAYHQRWKAQTTCKPGYIVPECANGPPQ